MSKLKLSFILLPLAAAAPFAFHEPIRAAGDPTCNQGATPTTFSGSSLDSFARIKSGIVYDAGSAKLKLQKLGGNFTATSLGIASSIVAACSGDFNEDGWVDFAGVGVGNVPVRYYRNDTQYEPAPNWDDETKIRTPRFVDAGVIQAASGSYTHVIVGCADLNGDTHQDVVAVRCAAASCTAPDRAEIFFGNGNGTFQTAHNFLTDRSKVGIINWSSGRVDFLDYNVDGKLDMVWGLYTSTGGGRVVVLINGGGSAPKFDSLVAIKTDAGAGDKGPGAVSAADFTGDGVKDLTAGGPNTGWLRVYPGLLGGSTGPTQDIPAFLGGATTILAADFSLDGKPDMIVGTDGRAPKAGGGTYAGGVVYYYESNGTAVPFSSPPKLTVVPGGDDFDLGFLINYDNDPDGTLDFVMADGNDSSKYYLFANRTVTRYVDCGTVESDRLDIGPLADEELTVTEVRMSPTPASVPATQGTIRWQATNDGGRNWVAATPCPDDADDQCATFSSSVGGDIRWRAELCSNVVGPIPHKFTPEITSVEMNFTYVVATNHYRGGPIARDNLIYIGAFRRPGDAGHFYAIDDETGVTLWDASDKLQDNTDRVIYTTADGNQRIELTAANAADEALQQTLRVPDAATAVQVIAWMRSTRFGLLSTRKMGSIENSSPGILSAPKPPYWYTYPATSTEEKAAINTYVSDFADRPQLAFVGSKDGALHAFYTDPLNPASSLNGEEAWAFVPPDVAARFVSDRAQGTITAYPDGSPTLASVKIGGEWRTVLVAGEGNGGRHVYALDVTETIDESNGNVLGPTPLWSFSDDNMGLTFSKPTVIRTIIDDTERWLAVFASGPLGQDVGDSVYALDVGTGELVWRFDLNDTGVWISTDITASETNDETGTALDGYIDRLFFADSKGRVWKLDPRTATGGAAMSATGSIDVGLAHSALFSTRLTTDGLGVDRGIAGTIAAAPDATGRLTLYFGTGGTDDTPAVSTNAFYAVYADTGEIRSKIDQSNGLAVGAKFYGGVVWNDGQLIFTTGTDLFGTGLCSPSAGEIVAVDSNTFAVQFTVQTGAKIVGPVFARGGEIYTVTLKGDLMASPFVSSPTSAGGPAPAAAGGGGTGDPTGGGLGATENPFVIRTWRQLY